MLLARRRDGCLVCFDIETFLVKRQQHSESTCRFMHEWIILTTRYGSSIRNPSTSQLDEAVRELFAAEDEEHPDCWIECGSEDKPLHTLSFLSNGQGRYIRYSDADMTEELLRKDIAADTAAAALKKWEHLINERYEEI